MNIYFIETPSHFQNFRQPVEMVSVIVGIEKASVGSFWDLALQQQKLKRHDKITPVRFEKMHVLESIRS
jgi:hypothetical protein